MIPKDTEENESGFDDTVCDADQEISPPGYKKPKKFSPLMEKALDAVAHRGRDKVK